MRIIIAPDSFKGSLSALQAGVIIHDAFKMELPLADMEVIPMADGGEGTLENVVYAAGGQLLQCEVTGPLGSKIMAKYGILRDNKTVVIEIAQIAGLTLVRSDKRNPLHTTTYGIGEVIKLAIHEGYRKFLIGLGGSATNDGGLGMLQALGVSFYNKDNLHVLPFGYSVAKVTGVDYTTMMPEVKECVFEIASDVDNPLCGVKGASATFGPQKGATPDMVLQLDSALANYASIIEEHLGRSMQFKGGAGAAGGLGFAFLTLGAEIVSGAELVAKASMLPEKIKQADWIITGEGQSDYQTLFGKVPGYIGKEASKHNVKAILVSGSLGKGYEDLYNYFVSCESIAVGPSSLQECINHAESLLFKKARNIARMLNTK
ncbi:glycerate kinase [Bacillus sp. HMF5848]|uniref:glycerate kinase family protein n=1 Tax=Bacillus sp. HMF5848 TaxID=2495421 RepID=UPI000F767630|nr:glycerate kinase [Bacillus sp. HMF5848]RSK26631.1 glycerate kinase [Bacillus sp. HMF5848]